MRLLFVLGYQNALGGDLLLKRIGHRCNHNRPEGPWLRQLKATVNESFFRVMSLELGQ